MAKRDIREMAQYVKSRTKLLERAKAATVLRVTLLAESFAKKNATTQFTGRNGRRLSGRLLNSIFSVFKTGSGNPKGFIGTKGIPYGRIHEEGGDIVPVKAKWLWLKQHVVPSKFRRITPKKFVQKMKDGDKRYKLSQEGTKGKVAFFQELRKKGKKEKKKIILFALAKKVKMPKRPYLRPAINEALEEFPDIMRKEVRKNLRRKR